MWKVKTILVAIVVSLFGWVQHLAKKSGKLEAETEQLKRESEDVKKTKIIKDKVSKQTDGMSDADIRDELYK